MKTIPLRAGRAAIEATHLPLAFSQVREDARIDAAVLAGLPSGANVVLVASGGDTAAWLAAGGRVHALHLVDVNPAQLALTRLKLHLLKRIAPAERLGILGHAPLARNRRAAWLRDLERYLALPPGSFGPSEYVARVGPDQAGRFEFIFAQLRACLVPVQDDLEALLTLSDPGVQTAMAAPGTELGDALENAFEHALSQANLVRLFGAEATRNPRQSFAQHFLAQTRKCLATQPAWSNPFLAQFLLGRFQGGHVYPWLDATPADHLPALHWYGGPMHEALGALPPGSVDFVQLSNILDWLSPAAASETLRLASQALRPGGRLLLRQLNSMLDICASGPALRWLVREAAQLHAFDQSFFYRALHLAEKPTA